MATLALSACAHSDTLLGRSDVLVRAQSLPPGSGQELADWLAANPDAPRNRRGAVYSALCDAHARAGRYAAAAEACRAHAALVEGSIPPGLSQSIQFWTALSALPPITASGAFDEPLTYGWTGMGEVRVRVSDESAGWGVDTGAEVSVLTVRDARRFGVRMLGGEVSVSGSTPGVAAGGLGVIDELRIGDATVRHVPVFVVPDESMTVQGRTVPPILGAPVLYAFGAVEFSDHGRRLRSIAAGFSGGGTGMVWSPAGVAVPVKLSRGGAVLHLDTGANTSEFSGSLRPLLSPAQNAALVGRSTTAAGVSGSVDREVLSLSDLALGVGGGTCVLSSVSLGEDAAHTQGRLGMDLIRACRTVRLDFRAMRIRAAGR